MPGRLEQFRDQACYIIEGGQIKYTECQSVQKLQGDDIHGIARRCKQKPAYAVQDAGSDDENERMVFAEPEAGKRKHCRLAKHTDKPGETDKPFTAAQLGDV